MQKRTLMVIVMAIALCAACTHYSIQKTKTKKPAMEKQVLELTLPSVLIDVCLFQGKLYKFLILYL